MTELVHGYGFIAVFVAALALRAAERGHDYHEKLHDFAEQLERLFMMALLVIFGGALTGGDLLGGVGWNVVVFALLAIFVIRPLSGWIGLAKAGLPVSERAVISFYGIRGIGSAYYVAYAMGKTEFEAPNVVWSALGLTVLVSSFLHGTTVTPAMRHIDARRGRSADRGPPRPTASASSGP